jgi:Ca2+-binding RTX toxin-like protein
VTKSLGAGETASTNSDVTGADPIGTSVKVPVAGTVTITEASLSGGANPPSGYSLLGQQVAIAAPNGTAAAPLRIEFRIDASLLNGGGIPAVFRNGKLVAPCTVPHGTAAAPNPCVEPFANLGGGDVRLVVRTSQASTWTFGRPTNPAPPKDLVAACLKDAPMPPGWNVVQGTSGDDVLIGTAGADILRGFAGDDILVGGGANDILCGGAGDDLLSGGTGHDFLLGDAGDDAVYGGTGDDTLAGGSGNDELNGGPGDDVLIGGSGDDLLLGGTGDDFLFGDAGNDQLFGEDGFDQLYGGPGRDVLSVGRRS